MKGSVFLLALACAAMLWSSCANNPTTFKESDSLEQMREAYIRDHPRGAFNNQIVEGQIARGMNIYEVLASWGMPNDTELLVQSNLDHLCWKYNMVNQGTKVAYEYRLMFEGYYLVDWNVSRVPYMQVGGTDEVPSGLPESPSSSSSVVKD